MAVQRGRREEGGAAPTAERKRRPVYYPSSDGKPMAETPLHRDEMMRLIQELQTAYAERADVYVSGNMLLYFQEGNPRASVSPDVFVTVGVPKLPERDIYQFWVEGAPPTFVIEVTSRSTRRQDLVRKRALYATLGVEEYVLYDPRWPGLQYLEPPLQGYRLQDGEYLPLEVGEGGGLLSDVVGMRLILDGGRLRLYDRRSGLRVIGPAERTAVAEARAVAEADARHAAEARATAEVDARRVAEARAVAEADARRAAEARIAELEARLQGEPPPA